MSDLSDDYEYDGDETDTSEDNDFNEDIVYHANIMDNHGTIMGYHGIIMGIMDIMDIRGYHEPSWNHHGHQGTSGDIMGSSGNIMMIIKGHHGTMRTS